MNIEKSTVEKCLICVLIVVVVLFLIKRNKENYESQNLMKYRINVRCGDDNELGFMVDGEESLDSESTKSTKSTVSNIIRDEKDLCIVDKMDDEVYKFATQERCDCNKKNGCTVCELKHSNDHEITQKLCQERKKKFSCLVDRMESDNVDYMKGLMLGSNVY